MSFAGLRVLYGRSAWLVVPRILGVATIMLMGGICVYIASGSGLFTSFYVLTSTLCAVGKVQLERRQYVRHAFQRMVNCKALGCSEILSTVTLDLSERGFFVQTTTPYSLLTRFSFELQVAADESPIRGHAVVRWINRHSPRGMGVEIVGLDETDRFTMLLEEVNREHLSERVSRFFGLT